MRQTIVTLQDIFKMQQLTLNKDDQQKITQATVALAGIGGVGSYTLEFLIRNGFINLKIADPDRYEKHNLRQLYMTSKTVGKKKVDIARKRIKNIYPQASVVIFSEGINQKTYNNFCSHCNIVCALTDRVSSQILLYMGAYENRSVLVRAGRAKWPNKHMVTLNIYDFRKREGCFKLGILNINPTRWGVNDTSLLEELIVKTRKGVEDLKLIKEIDEQNFNFRRKSFIKLIKKGNTLGISDKNKKYLLNIVRLNPENFYEMSITPELCSISASLVITAVKDIILDRHPKLMGIDLYHGKVIKNYS